jgi:AraC-like DNA-binding protein
MVWNKTTDEVIHKIQNLLHDFTLRYIDIAEIVGVSEWLVQQVCSKMTEQFRKERYSGINRAAKLKSNPMRGKTKTKHHNAKEGFTMSGPYKEIWAPDWWTGLTYGNRALEHQVVYAEANNLTEIPVGHVVHHIDHDKLNNHPDNLELMTRKDHALLHAYENFLERATTRAKARRVQEDSKREAPREG